MTGLNFLFRVIGIVIALIIIGMISLIVWGICKADKHKTTDFYDRVENALSKREEYLKEK